MEFVGSRSRAHQTYIHVHNTVETDIQMNRTMKTDIHMDHAIKTDIQKHHTAKGRPVSSSLIFQRRAAAAMSLLGLDVAPYCVCVVFMFLCVCVCVSFGRHVFAPAGCCPSIVCV